MNKKIKASIYIIGFVLFIALALLAYNYLTKRYNADNGLIDPDQSGQLQEQDEITNEPIEYLDFTVQDHDGNPVSLSDYIGTPIVLNFWASWCSPCKDEMPHFNKVSEEHSRDELVFLMVNLSDGVRETVEKAKKHVEENGYTFTVLYDTELDAAITYAVRGIPATYFINKEGHIVWGAEGAIDETTLRKAISLITE
ncbi:MAG: TlpA family protein disulfide reductase [Acetivibrionales bacterium]|jgi:thiol-disulfide isomerase/thioredoxin|nr:TlpA family protein disulfide reductase [Clostridiaceae bacterium]